MFKKTIPTLLSIFVLSIWGCVNDAEKHTQSELDPDAKDTSIKYEKAGARDATDGDTSSKDSLRKKSPARQDVKN